MWKQTWLFLHKELCCQHFKISSEIHHRWSHQPQHHSGFCLNFICSLTEQLHFYTILLHDILMQIHGLWRRCWYTDHWGDAIFDLASILWSKHKGLISVSHIAKYGQGERRMISKIHVRHWLTGLHALHMHPFGNLQYVGYVRPHVWIRMNANCHQVT